MKTENHQHQAFLENNGSVIMIIRTIDGLYSPVRFEPCKSHFKHFKDPRIEYQYGSMMSAQEAISKCFTDRSKTIPISRQDAVFLARAYQQGKSFGMVSGHSVNREFRKYKEWNSENKTRMKAESDLKDFAEKREWRRAG